MEQILQIRTDRFNIGIMGRSGSRSFISDIVGLYAYHVDFNTQMEDFNNKEIIETQTRNLNSFFYNVLVLRDPKERARSGCRLKLPAEFHGAPFLHKIDIESITHIIKFEEIKKYLTIHRGGTEEIPWDNNQWSLNDYSDDEWTEEYRLYNILLQKPILEPSVYKKLKTQIKYVNCKDVPGMRYKTWDS